MNKTEWVNEEDEEGNKEEEGARKNKQILYVMVALVGIVVVLSIVQTFQVRALNTKISEGAAALTGAATGAFDTSSWTEDEKMQYEHHGTVPARLKSTQSSSKSSSSAGGMVGGC
ncbi:hypothetical protein HZA99_00145 [Candidatus Woesearchaeota archaeon]|nr:hypothetical protein [Candidatus Woesearchaeota archaeon]